MRPAPCINSAPGAEPGFGRKTHNDSLHSVTPPVCPLSIHPRWQNTVEETLESDCLGLNPTPATPSPWPSCLTSLDSVSNAKGGQGSNILQEVVNACKGPRISSIPSCSITLGMEYEPNKPLSEWIHMQFIVEMSPAAMPTPTAQTQWPRLGLHEQGCKTTCPWLRAAGTKGEHLPQGQQACSHV